MEPGRGFEQFPSELRIKSLRKGKTQAEMFADERFVRRENQEKLYRGMNAAGKFKPEDEEEEVDDDEVFYRQGDLTGRSMHKNGLSVDDESDLGEEMARAAKMKLKLFAAELMGTFLFVYLGQTALTAFELIGTQNDMLARKMATIFAYGLAYSFASLLTLNLSGAYLNPAYSFASALFGQLGWARAFSYACAQYLGSFLAAMFLHATYSDKLAQRHTEGELFGWNSSLRAHGNILSTGKFFASHPPTEVSLTQLTISYTLATAHLVLIVRTIQEAKVIRIARSLRPLYLAGGLSLVLAAFSANGGPVWNPAQDFSPRLYIALFGWGSAAFNLYNYRYWWLCGLVAPHLGALLGFALHRLFEHLRLDDENPDQQQRESEKTNMFNEQRRRHNTNNIQRRQQFHNDDHLV